MSDNDVYGPVISGSASIAGAALTGKANKKMQREAMAWQTSERQAAQEYNTSERLASQNWQQQQRLDQNQFAIDVYNQYKSPKSLVEQYKAAGLNPRLAMNSAGDLSAASGSSGSAPSGTHVQPATVGAPYQDINSFSDGFKSIAEGLSSLAAAKKTGVDTSLLEDAYNDILRSYKGKADQEEVLGMVQKKYLDQKALADLQFVLANIDNKDTDTRVLEQKFDNLVREGVLQKQQADAFWEKHYAEMDVLHSQQYENTSHAQLNESIASIQPSIKRLNDALSSKVAQEELTERENTQLVHFQSQLMSITARIKSDLAPKEKASLRKEYDALISQYERMKQVFDVKKKAGYDKNAGFLNSVFLDIDAILGSIGQFFGGTANYSVSRSQSQSSVSSHSNSVNHSFIYSR